MFKIIFGVAFKILEAVFNKVAANSQKAETGCSRIKNKYKNKTCNKKSK
ncbi:MAG: hypothetical protein LBJ89_04050 [Holosporales bacterium]|jgi:hypothetical protein|nr:hypothetical protein [Holosporales bacterium]